LLVVKFRDLEGIVRLLVLKNVEILARLRGFLAFGIVKEEILESGLRIRCGRGVICA
jgi:hypothetical protein